MPSLNTIVQNTVDKVGLQGKLWSKVPNNRSLLGASANKSLVNNAPSESYKDFAEQYAGERRPVRSKVQDYDEERKSFQSDFRSRMESLKKANSEIKSLGSEKNQSGGVAREASQSEVRQNIGSGDDETSMYLKDKGTPQATAETNSTDRGTGGNVRGDMEAIQGFVKEYNSTVSYLNEGREVSGRFSALASSFSDSGKLSGSLDRIGISVNSDGQLSVDRSKLAESLADNPADVGEVLGADGLAGRVERKVEMASGQTERLFTPPVDALGKGAASSVKSMYGSDSSVAANAYSDVGSIYQNFG